MKNSFIKNVRETIRTEGLKQSIVAERANIPYKKFNAMLNGKATIKVDSALDICYALNKQPNDLLV